MIDLFGRHDQPKMGRRIGFVHVVMVKGRRRRRRGRKGEKGTRHDGELQAWTMTLRTGHGFGRLRFWFCW